MSDFRGRFLEDYAGGLLNVSKQEQSPTGEVLAQNGFPSDGSSIFVEDGAGVKSGLKLGVSVAECLEPTTLSGIVNVSYADRTYAKIKDLKIFATATASTQAALSQAVVESIQNLENSFAILEQKFNNISTNFNTLSSTFNEKFSSRGSYILVYDTYALLTQDLANLKEGQLAAIIKDSSYNGLYAGVYNSSTGILSWVKISS